jgi:predicted permease
VSFAAIASLIAGLVFGLAPAIRVSSTDPGEALKGGHGTATARLRRSRSALVVIECSLAVVLLAGAGLLIRSLARVSSVDPGFDPRNVLTVRIELPAEAAPTVQEQRQTSQVGPTRARGRAQRMQDLVASVQAIPGVDAVGFTDDLFIAGQGHASITIPGRANDSASAGELNDGTVSAGFFSVMRVPLKSGRYLTRDDVDQKIRALWAGVFTDMSLAEKERVAVPEPVVVNEAFVHRFFPGEEPIGKRFCVDPTSSKTYWYQIVGVIGDMHRQGLERSVIPEYYGPHLPSASDRADLLVRTQGDPLSIAPLVRQTVRAGIPNVTIVSVSTADAQLGGFSGQRRLQTWLLTVFAMLALTLAAIGVYGVVHYAVDERTREIGVRVALGASPADVAALVVADGMRMPAMGLAIGLAIAIGVTRVIAHLLYSVGPTDPVTFMGVGLTLAAVAIVACWLPARRAARLDPVQALRHE